jgi:hypothetical protein
MPLWRAEIPGRIVLSKFAGRARIDVGRLKRIYLRVADTKQPDPFQDVVAIFNEFKAQ